MTDSAPSKKKRNPIVLLFLIFPIMGIVAALSLAGSRGVTATPQPPPVTYVPAVGLIDQPAPDFTLKTLTGSTIKLSAYRGQWVFVNFWATWCIPCNTEMPTLQKFVDGGFGNYRGSVALIAIDYYEEAATIRDWLQKKNLTLPVILDPDGAAIYPYGVGALPITFVVDPEGIVRAKVIGELTPDLLIAYLKKTATEF
ncbi:MAG TPA: TlpA disulfide reductase family protein [Aggregatilineales bacterium]|nr:TlpA disulfide reductase family protein [Aggregatilineales bacterium]